MMNELELIKAFARIEGVDIVMVGKTPYIEDINPTFTIRMPYNPITDLALNCAARDKHKVDVDYLDNDMANVEMWHRAADLLAMIECCSVSDIPRAVIECIVKAHGGDSNE